jgi:hypothetical protein
MFIIVRYTQNIIPLFLINIFNEYAKINRFIVYLIIWFTYYLTLEVVSGKTIGKMITGMNVTFKKEHNKLISVLIRTISRLISSFWASIIL